MSRRPQRPKLKLRLKGKVILVPLGDGPILPTGGGPSIEERARPGRPALTQVIGRTLKTFDVPAFWDGISGGEKENVKPDVMEVAELADALPEIPFIAEGPFPYSGTRFVMDAPEWVNVLSFPSGGGFLQVSLVLKLVEYNDPHAIHEHKQGQHSQAAFDGGTRAPASIVLDHPMSLVEVAAKFAGDPGEAKAIGKANGIHDIKKKLPKGTHLTIPAG